MVSKKQK